MSKETPEDGRKKIIIAGLDNAGKTSMLKLVKNKMIDFLSIAPTRGIDRSEARILGNQIAVHDFGGQSRYRKDYLEQPRYFDETNAYIFVIDLQDKDRYELSLEYFDNSLQLLHEMEIKPNIFIFFHKYDGDYLVDYNDEHKHIREEFNTLKYRLTDLAKRYNFDVRDMFKTSIYEEWSVYTAFYDVWVSIIIRLKSIQAYLERLLEELEHVKLSMLLDAQGNLIAKELGKKFDDKSDEIIDLAKKSLNLFLEMKKTGFQQEDDGYIVISLEQETIYMQRVDSKEGLLYLVVLRDGVEYTDMKQTMMKFADSLTVFINTQTPK